MAKKTGVITSIEKAAIKNASERLQLINQMKEAIESNDALSDAIREVDSSFEYKIFAFPGDITSHRIATVIQKIRKKNKL